MLCVRIPEELEKRLDTIASKTNRSKSYYIRKAITEYIEDQEDYLLATQILAENKKTIPLEKVMRMFNVES